MSERLQQAYALMREQLQASFDKAKKRYDDRVKTTKFLREILCSTSYLISRRLDKKMVTCEQGSVSHSTAS